MRLMTRTWIENERVALGDVALVLDAAVEDIADRDLPRLDGLLATARSRVQVRLLQAAGAGNGQPRRPAGSSEPDDRLLTPGQAAEIAGVTRRWLYRHAGRLPFTRRLSRKAIRFSEVGLRRWLERKRS